MDFKVLNGPARVELVCGERLEAGTVGAFREAAEAALAAGAGEVSLDCGALRVLDSSGVGAMVFLHRRLAERGGRLVVAGLSGRPLELARLIRLDVALGAAPAVERAPAPAPRRAAASARRLLGRLAAVLAAPAEA